MTQECPDRGQRLIVNRDVELRGGDVGAERPSHLHRPNRPAARRAAAIVVEKLAQAQAKSALDEPAAPHVAGELQRQRAARLAGTEVAVVRGAARQDDRDARQRNHVVDNGWLAEKSLDRGQRRPHTDLAALALEALEHRGFLAADVGTGPQAHLKLELPSAAHDVTAEIARLARGIQSLVERRIGVRILDAQIDVALGGTHGNARNGHALDERERITLHQHAVGKCAGVAFVGIAGDVFSGGVLVEHGLPFDAGGKRRAAATAKPRVEDALHDLGLRH